MGGRSSKAKGSRLELEFARLIGGEKTPMSGMLGGKYANDVVGPDGLRFEVKGRRDGFRGLYKWLAQDGADALALRADRRPWLVVLPLERYLELRGETA